MGVDEQFSRQLGEAQRALHLVKSRNKKFSSKRSAKVLAEVCHSYLDATRKLVNSMENNCEGGPYSHYYTGDEVKGMFCHLISQFSKNLVDFLEIQPPRPSTTLFDIGDDSLEYILSFLTSPELYQVSEVCVGFDESADSLLVRKFCIDVGDDGKVEYLSGDGSHLTWSNEEDSIPEIDYERIEKLQVDVCCRDHMQAVLKVSKNACRIKEAAFAVGWPDCSNPEGVPLINEILSVDPDRIEVLKLLLFNKSLNYLSALQGSIPSLSHLKVLEICASSDLLAPPNLDFSLMSGDFPAIESISLSCSSDFLWTGLTSFPWERCISLCFKELSLPFADWLEILRKLERCESLELENVVASGGTMRLAEFFDFPFCSKLKRLTLSSVEDWLMDLETAVLEFEPCKFPALEHVDLESNFHPQTALSLFHAAPNLRNCSLGIDGDMFEWAHFHYGIPESEVLNMIFNSFGSQSLLEVFKVDMRLPGSNLQSDARYHPVFHSRFARVSRIRELYPQIKQFMVCPPGDHAEDTCIDYSPLIALKDITSEVDSQMKNFKEDLRSSKQKSRSGVKRRRRD
jgi:hypothetical protein